MVSESQQPKIKILTFMSYYVPGYKAGGALRTLLSAVEALGDEFDFRIVTRDRDYTDHEPYTTIEVDSWQRVGKAQVFYASPARLSWSSIRSIMRTVDHDMIYCLGFFDFSFTQKPLLLQRLGLVPQKPTIVAPQNELSAGALSIKKFKKQTYLAVVKAIGLYRGALLQASSELESREIHKEFGGRNQILVARNLNSVTIPTIDEASRFPKTSGQLRIAFLSRIAPKKNLDGVLAMLSDETLRGEIDLAIYGPVDDSEHWDRCQEIIRTLPPNIRVHYEGAVENDQVSGTLARHHLFFFPTLGESFGYVILESLLAGCPVLLSDTTPWANLEPAKAGWALPLEDLDSFVDIVQKCIDMDADDHAEWSTGARGFAHAHIENSEPKDEMRRLLLTAAQGSS
jgi:glycosyltransferase involved in cell wall biosynthesis